MRAVGHPIVWIGGLIGWLDRKFNRDTDASDKRRAAGVVALLILLVVVGAIAFSVERELLRVPFGLVATGVLASTLIAQRSLHRHVADVADALDQGGVAAGRSAVSRIVGRDTQALDSPASPEPRLKASRRISPMRWSRRCCGWSLPDSLARHSTRRSIPPTV